MCWFTIDFHESEESPNIKGLGLLLDNDDDDDDEKKLKLYKFDNDDEKFKIKGIKNLFLILVGIIFMI